MTEHIDELDVETCEFEAKVTFRLTVPRSTPLWKLWTDAKIAVDEGNITESEIAILSMRRVEE
jgi:hypothetical protein